MALEVIMFFSRSLRENEPKEGCYPQGPKLFHSLAQRTNQETSTPTKASPYMGRMQPLLLSLPF